MWTWGTSAMPPLAWWRTYASHTWPHSWWLDDPEVRGRTTVFHLIGHTSDFEVVCPPVRDRQFSCLWPLPVRTEKGADKNEVARSIFFSTILLCSKCIYTSKISTANVYTNENIWAVWTKIYQWSASMPRVESTPTKVASAPLIK